MKGKVFYDISSDRDLNEFTEWMNNHQDLVDFVVAFDGRYLTVEFEPRDLKLGFEK